MPQPGSGGPALPAAGWLRGGAGLRPAPGCIWGGEAAAAGPACMGRLLLLLLLLGHAQAGCHTCEGLPVCGMGIRCGEGCWLVASA